MEAGVGRCFCSGDRYCRVGDFGGGFREYGLRVNSIFFT